MLKQLNYPLSDEENEELNDEFYELKNQIRDFFRVVCIIDYDFEVDCTFGYIDKTISLAFNYKLDFNNNQHLDMAARFLTFCYESLPEDLSEYVDLNDEIEINPNLDKKINQFIEKIKDLAQLKFNQKLNMSNLEQDLKNILNKFNDYYNKELNFYIYPKRYFQNILDENQKHFLYESLQDPLIRSEIFQIYPDLAQMEITNILQKELKINDKGLDM